MSPGSSFFDFFGAILINFRCYVDASDALFFTKHTQFVCPEDLLEFIVDTKTPHRRYGR